MNKIFELDNTDYHYDDDIESFEYRKVRHENSDNSMENATYNFFIQDTNANILYSNGYVQQKLRIVNDNGTAIAEDNVALSREWRCGSYTIKATSDEVLSLYVIPQYTDRYENAKENNMLFDNLDMTECYLMINNIKVPTVSYMMDFEKEDYN
ncbi:uncharacterized protein TNCV_4344831 [Trichonephila clavipes]|nr:uncharacterized protein TNCV_4344831 [Trichonephila clavipes]